jgi:DNA-binding transcriptional LysR family regulator
LFAAQRLLVNRQLTHVFPEWSAASGQIYLVYPSGNQLPLKVRVFIAFLLEAINEPV